jgi:hypothetical protein
MKYNLNELTSNLPLSIYFKSPANTIYILFHSPENSELHPLPPQRRQSYEKDNGDLYPGFDSIPENNNFHKKMKFQRIPTEGSNTTMLPK